MSAPQPTPGALSARTAFVLFLFAAIFTALLAAAYGWTKPEIEAREREDKLRLIGDILPPALYDNELLADRLELPPTRELGQDRPSPVYRARMNGKPVALVLEAAAPDGYGGRIDLVIAVLADGSISGVRVTQHKETPGLGDYIDPRKDRNKESPWIDRFRGRSLDNPAPDAWRVKKDGGEFDYVAGATVTPRAVVVAVARTLAYARDKQGMLYAPAAREVTSGGKT